LGRQLTQELLLPCTHEGDDRRVVLTLAECCFGETSFGKLSAGRKSRRQSFVRDDEIRRKSDDEIVLLEHDEIRTFDELLVVGLANLLVVGLCSRDDDRRELSFAMS